MKRVSVLASAVLAMTALFVIIMIIASDQPQDALLCPSGSPSCGEAAARLDKIDLNSAMVVFTENAGQWDNNVRFRAHAGATVIWFADDGTYYHFTRRSSATSASLPPSGNEPDDLEELIVRASFPGSNPCPIAVGEEMIDYKCNYFIGSDPDRWRTNVPSYKAILLTDVYPGIDLRYYGSNGRLEYDLIVAPGADPGQIIVRYDGAKSISVNEGGELVVETGWGTISELRPFVYQPDADGPVAIEARYILLSDNTFGFEIEDAYDPSLALVIDPLLAFSTYLGGNSIDHAKAVAVDDEGCVYVAGYTSSTDFPTANPFHGIHAGGDYDVFVTKLSRSGKSLVYSTYLGGSENDWGFALAVDSSGAAYVTGSTSSTDFPTFDPYQADQGSVDAFVTKLSSSGNTLVYSTYLGGSGVDHGYGIAVDESGGAYVTGYTLSSDFPTANAYMAANQGWYDVFVTKLAVSGNSLVYSTYLGGSDGDFAYAVAVESSGAAYVTGRTQSTDFPTSNPYQGAHQGGDNDVFVTKLSSSGNTLVYSTYLGGSIDETGHGIAVDGAGEAHVTGHTNSTDFPTVNAFQGTTGGGYDAFVTRLSGAGNSLVYSTYLGGGNEDGGHGIAVDNAGAAHVTGYTTSSDFPTVNAHQGAIGGSYDAFVTKLAPSGGSLSYSTYLGGSGSDYGNAIAVDELRAAYAAGNTSSSNFPTVNPYQTDQPDMDAFVIMLIDATCGDVNLDDIVDVLDLSYLVDYLWLGNFAPQYPCLADIDSIRGINNHDAFKLNSYLFSGGPPLYCPSYHDSILPISGDVLEFRNTTVPAGEATWAVDVWLTMSGDQVLALSLPFAYSCATSAIECSQISFYGSIYSDGMYYVTEGLIDDIEPKGVVGVSRTGTVLPFADSGLVARLWFAVDPTPVQKEILFDTTTYPYGNEGDEHIVIFSKEIGGKPYACIPQMPNVMQPPNYVTTLADYGPGSLRAAIMHANTNPGPDTIFFTVSGVIDLDGAIPEIAGDEPTVIDGGSAPGGDFSVILDGSRLSEGNGFVIGQSSGNVISGLVIRNFPYNGIAVTGWEGVMNDIGNNLIYDNGGLAIDLGEDGVTENDLDDLDDGPNHLMNYPEIDSVIMDPDGSFVVHGRTIEPGTVIIYIARAAGNPAQIEDESGHGEAYGIVGTVESDSIFEFMVPNTVPQFSVLSASFTCPLGNTSELCPNFTLIPGPLVITAYSYPAGKGAPPSVVNLWITDPEGHYIGRNAQNEHFQDLFPATYEEEGPEYNDVVTIPYPIQGTYLIQIIGEEHAGEGDQYSAGVRINGSAQVVLAHLNDVPIAGMPPDTITYVVEENWHYVNGDADGSGGIDIDDVVYLINFIFTGGPIPQPPDAGDANCSYALDIDDVVYLITFIFAGGPEPCAIE